MEALKTSKMQGMTQPTYEFNYPLSFERNFDEEYSIRWMAENWGMSFTFASIYVVVIFGLKYFMRDREAFQLRTALIVWNFILAAYSIASTIRMMSESFYTLYKYGWEYSVCSPTIYFGDTAIWSFIFAASKVYELGDTVFIVLRKQPLIFLHWYHHITVLIFSWKTYAGFYAPGRWFASVNSIVHAFMYSYYFLRAMRYRLPRSFSMFVTSIQLSQMAFGIYVNMTAKWVMDRGDSCHMTYEDINLALLMYASYFLLFGQFFYNAYMAPQGKFSNKQKAHLSSQIGSTRQNGVHLEHSQNGKKIQ